MLRFLKRLAVIALLLVIFAAWAFPEKFGLAAPPVTRSASGGNVIVMDGDTLRVDHAEHRIYGIDAPELSQTCQNAAGEDWACGAESRVAMANLVKGHTITCEERAADRFDRVVATCRDETGRDLAQAMAQNGWAIGFGGVAESPYQDDADNAKDAQRGIWQGRFDEPSKWRATHGKQRLPMP